MDPALALQEACYLRPDDPDEHGSACEIRDRMGGKLGMPFRQGVRLTTFIQFESNVGP
jgi:hypothetical protein